MDTGSRQSLRRRCAARMAIMLTMLAWAGAGGAAAQSSVAAGRTFEAIRGAASPLLGGVMTGLSVPPPTAVARQQPERAQAPPIFVRSRPDRRKVVAGILGAVGGFFLGGYVGAALEPPCGCDDPGMRGWMIGAPAGAVAGGIVGVKVLWKYF